LRPADPPSVFDGGRPLGRRPSNRDSLPGQPAGSIIKGKVFVMRHALLNSCAVALMGVASVSVADVLNIPTPLAHPGGGFGHAVHGIADVNGDGFDDFIVGEPDADTGATQSTGRAHIVSGKTGAIIRTHSSPNVTANGRFGFAVVGLGDVNGDGLGDYAVGAPRENGQAGRVYVFSGANGALLYTLNSPSTIGFGGSLSVVPDCTGDGRPDLVVGHVNIFDHDGPAYVFNGATGALFKTLTKPAGEEGTRFSQSVAGIPDVNGDGFGDIAVGAPHADDGWDTDAGLVYIYSGSTGALLHTLHSPFPQFEGWFGYSVAGIPDLNGDGRGDIAVGALLETGSSGNQSGRVHIYSGATGAFVRTLQSPNQSQWGYFGYSLAGSADLNSDGRGEVVVGARDESININKSGRVYTFSGLNGNLLSTRVAPVDGHRFGASVSMVPDANGDGRPDLLVGGPNFTVGGTNNAGRAFLWRELLNDGCSLLFSPPQIGSGSYPFSTIGADTTGPAHALCNAAGSSQIESDVFYVFVADCTGPVEVSTCGTANFDTRLAVYQGCGSTGAPLFVCDFSNIIACNDDAAGCPGFTSRVEFNAVAGSCYLIRVGGYQSAQGTGVLNITCGDGTCIGDLDGNGVVNGADLGVLLNQWGTNGSADLNGDGVVNGADLGMLLNAWGDC